MRIFNVDIEDEDSIDEVIDKRNSMKPGDEYTVLVKRNGKNIEIKGLLFPKKKHHIFKNIEELTSKQKFLRRKWSKN